MVNRTKAIGEARAFNDYTSDRYSATVEHSEHFDAQIRVSNEDGASFTGSVADMASNLGACIFIDGDDLIIY